MTRWQSSCKRQGRDGDVYLPLDAKPSGAVVVMVVVAVLSAWFLAAMAGV